MTLRVFSVVLLIVLARDVDAQVTVGGVAVDSRLKRPLPCITVRLLGADSSLRASTRASATGRFEFSLSDSGAYRLRFEAWGFHPVVTGVQRIGLGEHSALMYGMWLYPDLDTLDRVKPRIPSIDVPPLLLRFEGRVPQLALDRVGDVFVRFAVDTAGRVDTTSIVMIRADSPDMDTMTRRYLARSIWSPGRVGDRAVCDLVGHSFAFNFR